MRPVDFQKLANKAGFKTEHVATGSKDWTRMFISKNGVSYGRASFKNRQLYNVKWYCIDSVAFEVFCLDILSEFGHLPTKSEYLLASHYAELKAEQVYQRKLFNRSMLPFKKRKAIQRPNPQNWLRQIFVWKWIVFRGLY